mgnify:CR=1 FL=1
MDLDKYAKLPTVTAIFDHYEKTRKNGNRPHLGGSQIGKDCDRAIWYSFRWAWAEPIEGRICRLFETGDLEETRLIKNLRDVGCTVWDRDPDTGRQVHFTAHGGHFGISLDGVIEGLRESAQPHVLEFKTMNDKSWRDTVKHGVAKSKPVYAAQVAVYQAYMEASIPGISANPALFTAINKDTAELHHELVPFNAELAQRMSDRAVRILRATDAGELLPRVARERDHFECRMCAYANRCWSLAQ